MSGGDTVRPPRTRQPHREQRAGAPHGWRQWLVLQVWRLFPKRTRQRYLSGVESMLSDMRADPRRDLPGVTRLLADTLVTLGRAWTAELLTLRASGSFNPSPFPGKASNPVDRLGKDFKYGLHMLARNPGFTVIAVLTLGLGIGANTAVFSIVNSVLLEPLSYPDAEELVVVWQDFTRRDGGPLTEWASFDNLVDWRAGNEVFDAIFAIDSFGPTLTGVDQPETLSGASFSYQAFQVLGIEPILGRSFRPEEDTAAAAESVVILGHSLWQRRFDGDEAVIGTTIALNGSPATVIGVMPPDFAVPLEAGGEIFAPLRIDATNSCGRGCVTIRTVARIKDGVSLERARSDMDAIAARLEEEYPGANDGVGVYLEPLLDTVVGPVRSGLLMLLGAVGFLLLIACANVAGLTLVRATGRQSEVAIRVAMGATRARLFQQMLTESLMLAIGGSIVGFVLALWGVNLLVRVIPGTVPRFQSVSVDSTALLFTLAVTVLTGLVFGLAPTLRASKPQLSESLKEGGRGAGTGVLGERLRASLVVAFAAAAALLAAVGLYGVISYSVGQRTREIGVRMALGAGTDDVMRLVVGRGMALMMLGVTIGLASSLALARLLESLLFGVGVHDPLTFVSVPVGLAIVAFVACWIPARRAARVDPISALRFE